MTKPVQLSDAAYRVLTNAKRPGESYSDVVLRVLGGRGLTELAGLRADDEIDRHVRALAEVDALDRPNGDRSDGD